RPASRLSFRLPPERLHLSRPRRKAHPHPSPREEEVRPPAPHTGDLPGQAPGHLPGPARRACLRAEPHPLAGAGHPPPPPPPPPSPPPYPFCARKAQPSNSLICCFSALRRSLLW